MKITTTTPTTIYTTQTTEDTTLWEFPTRPPNYTFKTTEPTTHFPKLYSVFINFSNLEKNLLILKVNSNKRIMKNQELLANLNFTNKTFN